LSNVLETFAEILSIQVAYISVGVDSWCKLSHIQRNIEQLDVITAQGDKLATFGPYAGEEQATNVGGEVEVWTYGGRKKLVELCRRCDMDRVVE
jgi:hypothetical protein